MSEEIKIEESSGNVFLDIGFSEEEAERELLRVNLAYAIHCILKELKLTPAKASTRFGLDPNDVKRLKKMNFEDFTVERLLTILKRLNRDVEIHIKPSNEEGGHLRVVATS
ncbi:XRE family transcriptional regulator [Candidatus Poribacteria bacterium]|nr:XRE family transcriptional regulator [Candidatus Poribacteria bacterium]